MGAFHSGIFDLSHIWVWCLLFVRISAMLSSLPGVGTEHVPVSVRAAIAMIIALIIAASGLQAPVPEGLIQGIVMLGSEFFIGYLLGFIPMVMLTGLTVAGQVTAGAIGLGQANMIDPSLGASFSVLGRVEILFGTVVFLIVDGHHAVIRAASSTLGNLGLGLFRPDMNAASLLVEQLIATFELSVIISAPVLVTLLVTQFVLGLITRFVPQVNIFIISFPLTIIVGLYIVAYSFPGVATHLVAWFASLEELIGRLVVV